MSLHIRKYQGSPNPPARTAQKSSIVKPISVDDYPYIRSVLVMRITSIPFSLSISLMLLTTGVSWTLYRPLWGLMMLGIALTPITMAVYKIQQRKKAQNKQRL